MGSFNSIVVAAALVTLVPSAQEKNDAFVESYEISYTEFKSIPRTPLNIRTIEKGWHYSFTDRSNSGVNGWSWSLLITKIRSKGELPREAGSASLPIKGVVIFHMSDGAKLKLWYTTNCEMLFDEKLYRWNPELMKSVFHAIDPSPACQ
jgi:hypothetical protein